MSEAIHYDRRRFIGAAVTAMAGAGLIASRLGELEPGSFYESSRVGTKPGTNGSGPVKQIGMSLIYQIAFVNGLFTGYAHWTPR